MAAEGTGIMDHDLACDVHDNFFTLFDSGTEPTTIEHTLLTQYEGEILSDGDREVFLAALIECLWSVGHPVEGLKDRLATMVATDAGASYWGSLYPVRRRALNRLLGKVTTPKPTPITRKKTRVPKKRLFEEGDYLAFTKTNGRVVPVIVWIVESRHPLRYDFVFPNLARPASPELVRRFFDGKVDLTDDELGVFLGKGRRPKVVTLEHTAARPHIGRFHRFARRPFRFPAWQCGTCGYCVTFADFERSVDEGGSRAMTPEELTMIGSPLIEGP